MRGHEILSSISWSSDVHPDTIASIEAAILDLDRKVHGTNMPTFAWPVAHKRLSQLIAKHKGHRKTAEFLGISKSFLYDVHCSKRPYTAEILQAIGLRRLPAKEKFVPAE